jgi:hypothetical protein
LKKKISQKGYLVIYVIILIFLLSSVAMAISRPILAELIATEENLRLRRIMVMTHEIMQCALAWEEKHGKIQEMNFPVTIYPPKSTVDMKLTVQENKMVGLRLVTVTASLGAEPHYILKQVRWTFPKLVQEQLQTKGIMCGGEIKGQRAAVKDLLYTSNEGAIFPDFKVSELEKWATATCLSPLELARYGLGGRMYMYRTKNTYHVTQNSNISGLGILVFPGAVVINKGVCFNERLVLVIDGDLYVDDYVKIQQALIFCKRNVYIGNNVTFKGGLFVQGNLQLGTGFQFTHLQNAASPFPTIAYVE